MMEELNSYLLQHKSISIPGLGTIYVERIPAQSDFVNKQLLPPAYHYRFDKYFDAPDKDFFTYLASKKEVADYEAIRMYNDWAYNFRNKISLDHPAEWRGVGKLSKDVYGEVVFEPASTLNSFLSAIPAERVIRSNSRHKMLVGDKELSNVEMSDYLQEETHVEKESWWIYALIICALALVIIFFHFYRNNMSVSSFGNQQTLPIR